MDEQPIAAPYHIPTLLFHPSSSSPSSSESEAPALSQAASSADNAHENDNFYKTAKCSPDGTCILTNSNDNYLRIYEIPPVAYDPNSKAPTLEAALKVRVGDNVYDCCWFPGMNSLDPATACFLSSSRDHPIHLWDAFTGKSRCVYNVVDHREQIVGPNSITFNLDGTKIYAGYNNMIQIFDTDRPGRNAVLCPTTPTRKSKEGQKGVISCIAFNPDRSGMYAAGSYSKTIGVYSEEGNELLDLKCGHVGGVTQVMFSPDGNYLYSAARRDSEILCWDLRQSGEILFRLPRSGDTNQRITFDIDRTGRWLATGDQSGQLLVYDLIDPASDKESRNALQCQGHRDTVSAVGFHPTWPLLVTCSGQRKFPIRDYYDSMSDSESSNSEDEECGEDGARKVRRDIKDTEEDPETLADNSLRLWHVRCSWQIFGDAQAQVSDETNEANPVAEVQDIEV